MAKERNAIRPDTPILREPGDEQKPKRDNHEYKSNFKCERLVFPNYFSDYHGAIYLLYSNREGLPMIKSTILDAIAWVLLGITLIFTIWYLFGNSPVETTITFSLVSLLIVKVWKISNDFSFIKGDYQSFKENTKDSFQKVKEDMSEMKVDIKKILSKK